MKTKNAIKYAITYSEIMHSDVPTCWIFHVLRFSVPVERSPPVAHFLPVEHFFYPSGVWPLIYHSEPLHFSVKLTKVNKNSNLFYSRFINEILTCNQKRLKHDSLTSLKTQNAILRYFWILKIRRVPPGHFL